MSETQLNIFAAILVAYRNARLPEFSYVHRSHSARMTMQQILKHIGPITNPMEVGDVFGRIINASFAYHPSQGLHVNTDEPWYNNDFPILVAQKLREVKEQLQTV